MNLTLGVRSLLNTSLDDLKRDLLFFDKIYLVGAKEWLFPEIVEKEKNLAVPFVNYVSCDFYKTVTRKLDGELNEFPDLKIFKNEIQYLIENEKLLYSAKDITKLEILHDKIEELHNESKIISDYSLKEGKRLSHIKNPNFMEFNRNIDNLVVRKECNIFNTRKDINAVPIVNKFNLPINLKEKKTNILKFVIKEFPIPDPSTSWEQIFDFKTDPDSRDRILGLKVLISELSNSNLSSSEIEDRIIYLMNQYQKLLKLHKIKFTKSIIESAVILTSEILEDVVKLKFSDLFKKIFDLRKENVSLLESEINTESYKVSYIIKAKNKF